MCELSEGIQVHGHPVKQHTLPIVHLFLAEGPRAVGILL